MLEAGARRVSAWLVKTCRAASKSQTYTPVLPPATPCFCRMEVIVEETLAAAGARRPPGPGAAPVGASQGDATPAGVMPWETAGPYPASYDLRDHGKVTPVRSQDNFS